MQTEPFEAAETPPAFGFGRDGGEIGDSNCSISVLISDLRTAFRSSNFDHVEEILIAREEKLKRKMEKKKKQFELSRERLEIERLEKTEAEEALKSCKANCAGLDSMREKMDAMRERAKMADERAK
ncbi:hypothetical protein TIFTF001_003377 [Ficus carica]|uniref:Uncharacterized protein n=1 Tax=Ficus carica TaxID=3494 RepID=A0AA87Z7M2_FICCA|nr:hypothetical protein TIFTF001_003377 [Ficus carica]